MINRFFLYPFLALLIPPSLYGQVETGVQSEETQAIEAAVPRSDIEMHIRFLAADEFMGRDTGSPQLDIAGRYIATWFRTNGVNPAPGQKNYYQSVPFRQMKAPDSGHLAVGNSSFVLARDFIILNSPRGTFEGPLIVLDYGSDSELENVNVEGKVAIVKAGISGQVAPHQWLMSTEQKNRSLRERGAEAVIELYDSRQISWEMLSGFLNRDRLEIADQEEGDGELPHLWLNSAGNDLHAAFRGMQGADVTISVEGDPSAVITSNNIIGYVEGTDPELRDEYVLLGAHYDHIGTKEQETGNYIYNGARDNAVGVSAILLAARYLAANPPERSVIFAAWTAEEIGLLGSGYFAENPVVPLEQIIFNLNIDGAGYNDTTRVTVLGLERTEAEEDLRESAEAFGLEAIPDPVPEQNLFDRSDNVNFAGRGIPAPTYSLGITAFDDEIEKYYHTVHDDPGSIDYPYITRYIRSFLLAAQKVANSDEPPFWREGDIYEEAGRELYGKE
ncbi:MAG: M28 family peptidase [Balneolaceae bacterium]